MIEETSKTPPDTSHCPEKLWGLAKTSLAGLLPSGSFKTWIEPLKISRSDAGGLVLAGPNPFFINWVKSHFQKELGTALAEAGLESPIPLEFITDLEPPEMAEPMAPVGAALAPPVPAASLLPRLSDRFTFENFVVGDSNRYAHSAAQALTTGDLGADALFISSDHGLGKSHLSLALGRAFQQTRPHPKVFYLTAEEFTNEMTHALKHGLMEEFKTKYRQTCDVLVLEEVQFLAGKEKIQAELCFTLDCLMERGRKMVFTSPQEPKAIPRLGRSLRSRLGSAILSPMSPPDAETRLKILLQKAKADNFKVARGVLEYLAERVTTDVRQLESSLVSLRAKSQLLGRQVDLDMAREVLTHMGGEGQESGLTLLAIRAHICRHYQLEASEMTSRSRTARLNEARAMGIYLAHQLTPRTLEEIGQAFGRSHSSVVYACHKLEERLSKDPKAAGRLDFLRRKLLEE
ncbi:MAG: chromosomal replication initiator protein DnaA [Candidatus Adiutrix sp.]|jgi:chromosomal replication initiator protein|nr:chromosomal replication initiator protein DnaA [Candidatus Adiutrix sp.]